jgi:phosphopantothenoylcysteine decarboxylase/phosphopantothenate--cysteine ligase
MLIAPQAGELASGLTGMGRLEEPQQIIEILRNYFSKKLTLAGKHVLISSGPTVESIDPVRYISNHSTGRMGYALALEAAMRGAQVTFISGPVNTYPDHHSIKVVKVTSAAEMHSALTGIFDQADITIMAAAIADYTPQNPAAEKLKKKEDVTTLNLVKTIDILSDLGKRKNQKQILVGFALETNNELPNASIKLKSKNLDFIILNSLKDESSGFGFDTNKISIIDKDLNVSVFDLKTKSEVAADIFDHIQQTNV